MTPEIQFKVSRSSQGFYAVPLWSQMKEGEIEKLFRLHVWIPYGKERISESNIHTHQAFA
jgi:hypothetical protein